MTAQIPYLVRRFSLEHLAEYKANIQKSIQEQGVEATQKSIVTDLSDPRNIALFAYLVLDNYFYRELKNVHYRALDYLQIGIRHKPNKATKAYRGFGKTTIQWVLATVYESCYNIHPYVVVNSYNDTMSIDKMKLIRDEFEDNETIKWLYGNPIENSNAWNKSDITVFGKVRIKTISTGQNPRGLLDHGNRPTKVVSDDILDDQDVRSGILRDNALNWYKKALMNCIANDGVMEILNTPMHPEDIIETIFSKEAPFQKWDTLKIAGLENGESVDPDWKTTTTLNDMAQDEYTFSQEIMCDPVLVTSGMVKYDMLRFWYDESNTKEITSQDKKLPKVESLCIHCDCTKTGKETSDYFSCGAIGEGEDKNYYLVDYILEKMDEATQAKATIEFYLKLINSGYKIKKLTYDEKANQGFGFWIKKLAKEEYGLSLPIEELKYPNDKIQHFQPHLPHFIANRSYLPKNHKSNKLALDQLLAFPQKGVHDDFVDMYSGGLDNFKYEPFEFRTLTKSIHG